MKRYKKIVISILLIGGILFISGCASKPKFKGKGDLCGLVIDENNCPVKDFIINCRPVDGKIIPVQPVLTNESGLFVFNSLPSGKYSISGEKNNFQRIRPTTYWFEDRAKIVCFQTKSYKSSILQAEELIRLGQPGEARKVLKGICCEKDSDQQLLVKLYQFYTAENKKEKRAVVAYMKKRKLPEASFYKKYTEKLEEIIK